MRRAIILCSAASFASALLGVVAGVTLALPAVVGAQDDQVRSRQFILVGSDGSERGLIGEEADAQGRMGYVLSLR